MYGYKSERNFFSSSIHVVAQLVKIIFSVLNVYACNLSSLSVCQRNCLSPSYTAFRGAVKARLSAHFRCLVNVILNNLHLPFMLSLTPAFFPSLPPSIV